MRLSRTTWLVLGIAIFVIAAIVLYMLYQGQANKRQEARDELQLIQDNVPMLLAQMGAAQSDLAEKENELAQWEDTIDQLEQQRIQLEAILSQTQEGFPTSAESIEYDEELFSFALENNVDMVLVTATELDSVTIEDIAYETATFDTQVRGEVVDILAFINTIINDSDFRTAAIAPVNILIPEPLNNEEKEILEEQLRTELTIEALMGIPTEGIVGFTLEAINDVVGDEYIDWLAPFDNDGKLDALSLVDMAASIKERIANSIYLEQNYESPIADDLAELILQHIETSIVNAIVNPLADRIAVLITPGEVVQVEGEGEEEVTEEIVYDMAELVELLGYDMATILGEDIASAVPGDIAALLNGYIATIIENKMLDSVAESIQEIVINTLPGMIEEIEMPLASISLIIYVYQGEGG